MTNDVKCAFSSNKRINFCSLPPLVPFQKIRRQVAACKSRGIQALVRGEARLNDHFMGKYGKVIKRYPDVSCNVGPPVISWFI